MSDAIRLTRQELYDRVWTTPACKLGPELRMSGRGLAKLCCREGVPVPGRGYWEKLRFGKAPPRPALPSVPPSYGLDPLRDAVRKRAAGPSGSANQGSPGSDRPSQHPLLVGAREHFDSARVTDDGYLKPLKRLVADLFVSKEALSRALETANELFLSLENRNHAVVIAPAEAHFHRPAVDEREKGGRERWHAATWGPGRPTIVLVGDIAFGLTIYEVSKEVEMRLVRDKYVPVADLPSTTRRNDRTWNDWTIKKDTPTGRFCLRVYSPYPRVHWEKEWRESTPGELPSKFPMVAQELKRAAPMIAKLVEESRHQAELEQRRWEAQQLEWERQREEARRRQARKESHDELLAIVDAWAHVRRLEDFFEDAERRASKLEDGERVVVLARLKQARDMVGGTDALRHLQSWKAPEDR